MNCDEALTILLDPDHHERGLALNYLLNNPPCLARVEQFGRAILSTLAHEIPCVEARLHLAADYEQQLAQGAGAYLFPDLHAHLARCPDCRLEYQLLQETHAIGATAALPPSASSPTFDLSFITEPLPPVTATAAIWLIHDKVRTLFQEVKIAVSGRSTAIAALTPQLAPKTFALAMRGGADDAQFAVMVLPDEDARIHFQVETKPFQDNRTTITFRVFATETDSPIADVRVILRYADGALVTSSLTDQHGAIELPSIPAASYVIQAHYEGRTWELPITVTCT